MRIHSVTLKNFKSFGDDSFSQVIVEPSVTAIIGKNESGKSNILEGVSQICFYNDETKAFDEDNLNRNSESGSVITYEIIFKSTKEEMEKYNISEESQAVITENSCEFTGGFCDCFNKICEHSFSEFLKYLEEYLEEHPIKGINKGKLQALYLEGPLDTKKVDCALGTLQELKAKVPGEERNVFGEKLKTMIEDFYCAMSLLPTIFYRNDKKILLNEYRFGDTKKELDQYDEERSSLLHGLLNVIGIDADDFLTAMQAGLSGLTIKLRDKIQKAINEKVNEPFHKFYEEEKINLSVVFDNNIARFSVTAGDGTPLLLSERSNGLRWYINMFIDALSQNINTDHVVYLFDEPGISLHVNAQRKLLELFDNLADQGKENQVIYTTHSPYMLDTTQKGVDRIRAVVKAEDEISRIYKTPYDSNIAPKFQEDTLAPLIAALGMNFSDTFGPAKDKLNVVTEGLSDSIFLMGMAKKLGRDLSRYAFIPAAGASNCMNISTILFGWGCKNVILYDYDKGGVESGGNVATNKYEFECGKQYMYIKECTEEDITKKTYKKEPVHIEDLVPDLQKFLEDFNHLDIEGKPLCAKYYMYAIEDEDYECADETISNFRHLFERLDECFEKQK